MEGIELFEKYKNLSNKDQIEFESLYHEYKNNEIMMEYDRLDLIERKLNVASSLQGIYDETGKPFFDVNWIVKKIFKFTDEEIKVANAIKRKNN